MIPNDNKYLMNSYCVFTKIDFAITEKIFTIDCTVDQLKVLFYSRSTEGIVQ